MATVKDRARDELRNYAFVSGYLLVCFTVLWFYETTWLYDRPMLVGLYKGESIGSTLAGFEQHSALQLLAKCLLGLMLLLPLIATKELSRTLGHGRLRALLLGAQRGDS